MQTEGRAPLTDGLQEEGRPEGAPRKRRVGLFVLVAVTVVVLDQVSKAIIVATMPDRLPIRLLGGLVSVNYTRNPGAAFSVGTGFTLLFTALAVGVIVLILRTAPRLYSVGWAIALGALLGGAVGNLIDRLLRAPGPGRGYVVDWIQLPHWPVFNVADSAIVCAACGLVLLTLLGHDLDGTRRTAPHDDRDG
jgi:lipoprotein signal peptidase